MLRAIGHIMSSLHRVSSSSGEKAIYQGLFQPDSCTKQRIGTDVLKDLFQQYNSKMRPVIRKDTFACNRETQTPYLTEPN